MYPAPDFSNPEQKHWPADFTYGKIIHSTELPWADIIHKLLSASISIFIYIFYFVLKPTGEKFIYFTVLGMNITMLTRVYAAIHIALKVKDDSMLTMLLNAAQSFNFAIEGTVFVFYWAALSPTDIPTIDGAAEHASNIFVHFLCFVLAMVPVLVERLDYSQKFLLLFEPSIRTHLPSVLDCLHPYDGRTNLRSHGLQELDDRSLHDGSVGPELPPILPRVLDQQMHRATIPFVA